MSAKPPEGPAAHEKELGPLWKAEPLMKAALAMHLPSNGGGARVAARA